MADLCHKFASKREDWETPNDLFDPLNREFRFTLDVCASAENTKCDAFFTEETDALGRPWNGICWMNLPFINVGKWVKKAYSEAQAGGTIVVCLLPSRTNTRWWHDYVMKSEVRFILGRPRFNGAKHGLPQPLAIVVMRRKAA